MEEELEEQMRRDREEFDRKRELLKSRADERRSAMRVETEAMASPKSRAGKALTAEEIKLQHEQDTAALSTALKEQEKIQGQMLQRKIAERQRKKDLHIQQAMQQKFKEAVLSTDIGDAIRDVESAQLTEEERKAVLRAMMVTKWQSWSSEKGLKAHEKAANKWMVKAIGKELELVKRRRREMGVGGDLSVPEMPAAYQKVLQHRDNVKSGGATSPTLSKDRRSLLARTRALVFSKVTDKGVGSSSLLTPSLKKTGGGSAIDLLRSATATDLTAKQPGRAGSSLNLIAEAGAPESVVGPEVASLKAELEAARVKAEQEAARALQVEEKMRALEEQLSQQAASQASDPGKGLSTSASTSAGGAGEGQAPTREEFVKILESSSLAGMQEKLSEVETLLRKLLAERNLDQKK